MTGPSDLVSFLLTGGNEDQTSDNVNFGNFPTGVPQGASGGSVTSVGLSMPADFTVTNSPIVSTGTLTTVWANKTAGQALMGPSLGSSAAAPTFRYPDYPHVVEGRLTTSSTLPLTISDQTAQSTIYFLPYNGNRLLLYTSSAWQPYNLGSSGVSIAVPSTQQRNFDVFIYDNSGTLTLETVDWATNTATNSPTAGSNVLINVATTNCAVGDLVTIQDGTHTEITSVISFVSNTSIHCNLVNSYTTPTICWQARATALTTQDGVQVKTGATNKRYLGTCRTTATSGKTEDSLANRLVWNLYNQVNKHLLFQCQGGGGHVYGTAAFRAWNNAPASNQVTFVIGIQNAYTEVVFSSVQTGAIQVGYSVGIGLDANYTSNNADDGRNVIIANVYNYNITHYRDYPAAGFHTLTALEEADSQNITFGAEGAIKLSGFVEA